MVRVLFCVFHAHLQVCAGSSPLYCMGWSLIWMTVRTAISCRTHLWGTHSICSSGWPLSLSITEIHTHTHRVLHTTTSPRYTHTHTPTPVQVEDCVNRSWGTDCTITPLPRTVKLLQLSKVHSTDLKHPIKHEEIQLFSQKDGITYCVRLQCQTIHCLNTTVWLL